MFFYIHIPFCRQRCLYCKFALTPEYNELKIHTYIAALSREIGDFFQANPDVSIETIYFWGGTPSVLSPSQIADILGIFPTQKDFQTPREITLESNPEDITTEYLQNISDLGITRLSLGIQTLCTESLQKVGRADSNEPIYQALDIIANGPIENVSIDLIAWLPCTTPWQITRDLEEVLSRISPKHVSIYMLEDESYPEDWKSYLPGEEAIRQEYLSGVEWLKSKWFYRYELSNFALPGFESKHNRSYWNHSPYRGFWLSAASFFQGARFVNSSSFSGYYRWESKTEWVLSEESLRIERMMFGMRTQGIDRRDISDGAKLAQLIEQGLLETRE